MIVEHSCWNSCHNAMTVTGKLKKKAHISIYTCFFLSQKWRTSGQGLRWTSHWKPSKKMKILMSLGIDITSHQKILKRHNSQFESITAATCWKKVSRPAATLTTLSAQPYRRFTNWEFRWQIAIFHQTAETAFLEVVSVYCFNWCTQMKLIFATKFCKCIS